MGRVLSWAPLRQGLSGSAPVKHTRRPIGAPFPFQGTDMLAAGDVVARSEAAKPTRKVTLAADSP
ncbi:putative protein OS=Bosea thiooxidans OX=53254 GN=SAMN05660750_03483 PE=4 SV=1 [Bosea thiooxidans]|uniref:Uncharacterized protein n=1 Tax=Bosea thiooxidans TaxID=53254 RepID=A0A1T5FT66_9HYPH|nr:hypothetical protein SAMN05660750_03483 [Bosea thiooxidans]